ncbi:MAG TPA: hypothetical protein VK813_03990 [Edaphobacter sp.]|nr:hypothetical protein [Edaphobacter sp.]
MRLRELPHDSNEVGLAFEADTEQLGHGNLTAVHADPIWILRDI